MCFLEAMTTEPDNFLANPRKKNLPFDACQQFIIPMRTGTNYTDYNDTHYDVVVVNCNRETMTADIVFYDSLGWQLGALYQAAIQEFFKQKGFHVTFNSIAKRDQLDGYNCGPFATLRAIEIASHNLGIEENLIQKFFQGNYKDASNDIRLLLGYSLKELGFNVKIDEALAKSTSFSQRGASYLSEFAKILDNLNVQIQKLSGTSVASSVQATPLAELDATLIFKKCNELRAQMRTILKQKLKVETKTPEDEEVIQFLFATILAVNIACEEYKAKMKEFMHQEESEWINATFSFLSSVYQQFRALSTPKKIIYGGLGLVVTILGSTYSLALFFKLAAFLPTNPWLLVGMSALAFVAVLEGKKAFSKADIAENEAKIDAVAEAATTATLLEVHQSIELDKAAAQVPPAVLAPAQSGLAVSVPVTAPLSVAADTSVESIPVNVPVASEPVPPAKAPTEPEPLAVQTSDVEPEAAVEETAPPVTPYRALSSRRRQLSHSGPTSDQEDAARTDRRTKRKMEG